MLVHFISRDKTLQVILRIFTCCINIFLPYTLFTPGPTKNILKLEQNFSIQSKVIKEYI